MASPSGSAEGGSEWGHIAVRPCRRLRFYEAKGIMRAKGTNSAAERAEGEKHTMLLGENLETPRLTIRSWRRSDKDFTLSLWGDRENGKYMSDPVRENMDEAYLKCVDEMENDPEGYYLVVEWKEDHTPVGTCCIFPEKNGNFDIGYCIAKDHWKEGLGTEVVDAIIRWVKAEGGKSITGEVADINLVSAALLRKFGFSEDRKTRYKNGEKRPGLTPIITSWI